MTSYISPIELVDDPDTFNCLGYTQSARLSAPGYTVKDPWRPHVLKRQNNALISRGNIQPGDTGSGTSIYD